METGCNFPDALRLVMAGERVRRAGWDPLFLYISRSLDRVDLVREGRDEEGLYIYREPYLAAIGGPPVEDIFAADWRILHDPRVPTEDGGERAQAAELAVIDAEEEAGANG
jgi:hypothetical protein